MQEILNSNICINSPLIASSLNYFWFNKHIFYLLTAMVVGNYSTYSDLIVEEFNGQLIIMRKFNLISLVLLCIVGRFKIIPYTLINYTFHSITVTGTLSVSNSTICIPISATKSYFSCTPRFWVARTRTALLYKWCYILSTSSTRQSYCYLPYDHSRHSRACPTAPAISTTRTTPCGSTSW